MPQLYLVEAPGPQRDAWLYGLREAHIEAVGIGIPQELPHPWPASGPRLVLVADAHLADLAPQVPHLQAAGVPFWVLVEPGSFSGLIESLRLGAEEVVSRDRSSRDLAAMVSHRLRQSPPATPAEEPSGMTIELASGEGRFTVPPERLVALLAQMCDDVARVKRRYDAELEQRKRVERALMESEAFYQSLVETLPLALFRKDLNGRIMFANQQLCEKLRRTPEEIVGKTDYDFFPPDLAEKYRADDRQVMETRQNLELTEKFQTPAGEQRFMHVVKTPVFDSTGKLVGIQGVFSDVTDRILTENALEQERSLLDCLITNSPDNIYFKDLQGRYLRINPAKATRSGLSDPTDAIGRSDFDFFSPEHARRALADELEVLQTEAPLIAKEEQVTYPNGTSAWMATTKLPLKDQQGRVIGTFGVSHDITQLKEAQDALRRAAEAAEGANRAKSDFLANMSHEIRTPLNAVLGMTELVLGTPLTPVQRDYLKLVHESGESLLAVINDILDFSKIEAGKFRLEPQVFEFRELLGDTLKSLGLRAHRKGLELVCDVASDVPEQVVGDANRVRQIVVNLIGNAIKFTETGEIVASVSVEEASPRSGQAPVEFEGFEGTPVTLHFRIADTGIGIPVDKFHTIFQAFEQADASTTRRFGGTGLGLAITSRLVDLMGGRIWVDSEVGKGSTFHFTATFLVSQTQAATVRMAPPELLQNLRVLVVDDNGTNRRILAEMLTSWGMRPVLVSSAQDALQQLRTQSDAGAPFSLVLTDVNMPEASGFDLVQAARKDGSLCEGIIVMLTSSDRSDDVAACERLGIDTYLIKPVKQSELFNAILQSLGARHTEEWTTATLAAHRQASRALTVLLAEDSHINQKLAVGLLERWGHRVEVAENGAQALSMAQTQRYDVVLMDVQMPEMDGLEATQALREWEQARQLSRLPIVAMTAHALSGDRERCLAAGMDDYITKPIRTEALFQSLERLALAVPDADDARGPDVEAQPLAVTTSGVGAVDWAQAQSAVGHDLDLLRDVVEAFCDEAPVVWQRLLDAAERKDLKLLERAAHTLKNLLSTFGVVRGADLACQLELAVRTQQALPTPGETGLLERELQTVLGELQRYLHSPSSLATIERSPPPRP